jgi:hypothetical protein
MLGIAAIALTALALSVWIYELRDRKAFEAMLTTTEHARFDGLRRFKSWREVARLVYLERNGAAERRRLTQMKQGNGNERDAASGASRS